MLKFRLLVCAVIAAGLLEHWPFVATDRWWVAFGCGVVLGVLYAIQRWVGLIFAGLACVGGVGMLMGFGGGLEGSDRALFSALALGLLTAMASHQGTKILSKTFGNRRTKSLPGTTKNGSRKEN